MDTRKEAQKNSSVVENDMPVLGNMHSYIKKVNPYFICEGKDRNGSTLRIEYGSEYKCKN